MRHINPFPVFKDPEIDELKLKIVMNVTENWTIARETDRDHFDRAAVAGLEWTKYPCWLSTAKWEDGKGFKKFKFKGHTLYIHRTSCEIFNGPVPADNLVDHLCRVRGCCQHMHLEAVTHAENILRGANENKLLREGAPPPVSAKEINPKFFEEPTINEIECDFLRRAVRASDIKRVHDCRDGPLPPAREGFVWEQDTSPSGLVGIWYLNPIRRQTKLPITVPATLFEATQCYTPRRQEPGAIPVSPQEATIPLPNGRRVPVQFTGELPKLTGVVDRTETGRAPSLSDFNGTVDRFPEYKQYEFGVKAPISPVGPEENGYVPENASGGWLRRKLRAFGNWLDQPVRWHKKLLEKNGRGCDPLS